MLFKPYLTLLSACTTILVFALDDEGPSKTITELNPPIAWTVDGKQLPKERYYRWRGAIRTRVWEDDQKCLTVQREFSEGGFTSPKRGDRVFVNKCPDKWQDVQDKYEWQTFSWLIKGMILFDSDNQPVVEAYIKSEHPEDGADGHSSLCLTSFRDPMNTPRFKAENIPTSPEEHKYWFKTPVQGLNIPESHQRQKNAETSWGPVFLDRCNPRNSAQMWHIGIGQSPYGNDPENWTWIRPKDFRPAHCITPDYSNCSDCPNIITDFRRGLMRPWYEDKEGLAETQVGCSPTLFHFHPSFIRLDNKGNVDDAVLSGTETSDWRGPYLADPDVQELFLNPTRRRKRWTGLQKRDESSK